MRRSICQGITLGVLMVALASCQVFVPTGDHNVKVMTKTSAHPLYNMGSDLGYVVDGVEGKALTLTVGVAVTFGINAPGHPFYISTDPHGGTGYPGKLTSGVDGQGTTVGLLTFTPSAPGTVYYDCGVHDDMGGTITITP